MRKEKASARAARSIPEVINRTVGVLKRPRATVEGMRWLFALTAVASLVLTLPAPLSS